MYVLCMCSEYYLMIYTVNSEEHNARPTSQDMIKQGEVCTNPRGQHKSDSTSPKNSVDSQRIHTFTKAAKDRNYCILEELFPDRNRCFVLCPTVTFNLARYGFTFHHAVHKPVPTSHIPV